MKLKLRGICFGRCPLVVPNDPESINPRSGEQVKPRVNPKRNRHYPGFGQDSSFGVTGCAEDAVGRSFTSTGYVRARSNFSISARTSSFIVENLCGRRRLFLRIAATLAILEDERAVTRNLRIMMGDG